MAAAFGITLMVLLVVAWLGLMVYGCIDNVRYGRETERMTDSELQAWGRNTGRTH